MLSKEGDAASWELRSISGTNTSPRPIPESPHDVLCRMQRSHGERIYALRRLRSEKWPLSEQFVAPQL